jgi:ferric iron reductase protein FhuF
MRDVHSGDRRKEHRPQNRIQLLMVKVRTNVIGSVKAKKSLKKEGYWQEAGQIADLSKLATSLKKAGEGRNVIRR